MYAYALPPVRKRRAFTLTELAIVLGILGTVLGAIWVAVAQARLHQQLNQAVTEILTISSNIRSLYSDRHRFTQSAASDITCQMVNSGVFPANMLQGGACAAGNYPMTPWGVPGVIITGAANNDPTTFYVDFVTWGISPQPCAALLAAVVSAASVGSGLVAVWTGAAGADTDVRSGNFDVTNFSACTNAAFRFQLQ